MDEKFLIKRIRNSFKSGLSRAEISRRLQSKGYKLEYIDLLIKKARKPRKILLLSISLLLLLAMISILSYPYIIGKEKPYIPNPMQGKAISPIQNQPEPSEQSEQDTHTQKNQQQEAIKPSYISYLLNEIGAWKLHRNPATFEKPYINFDISGEKYYSEIGNDIKTYEGETDKADITFYSNKEEILTAVQAQSPLEALKQSLQERRTRIEQEAGRTELLAKGYLSLYNELK
ncbi:MAG: hypothetical protein ACP5D2_00135 [Candidatus Nanoarchaeia archaeon]